MINDIDEIFNLNTTNTKSLYKYTIYYYTYNINIHKNLNAGLHKKLLQLLN